MFAECSNVGIDIDLDSIKSPDGELEKWLTAFPSFGFLFSVKPDNASSILSVFESRNLDARVIGQVVEGSSLHLVQKGNDTWFGIIRTNLILDSNCLSNA